MTILLLTLSAVAGTLIGLPVCATLRACGVRL